MNLINKLQKENEKLKNTDLKQAKIEYLEVLNEKLQKENEELKEKTDINIAYAEYLEKILNEYKKESVSKQKIKEVIKELEDNIYRNFIEKRLM